MAYSLITLSGTFKGFNAINAINGLKAAALKFSVKSVREKEKILIFAANFRKF